MKLVTFKAPSEFGPVTRLGAIENERVIDLQLAYLSGLAIQGVDPKEAQKLASTSLPARMEEFIAAGKGALDAARQTLELVAGADPSELRAPAGRPVVYAMNEISLRAPLRPASLRDFIAFEDHAKQGAARRGEELNPTWYERPIYYKGNHRSIIGPGADLHIPSFTKELDFEMEVAAIVGKPGIDLDDQQAAELIFGFTIMNDWSARDVQRVEMATRLGPAKSKDFATSLGPWITTVDEIGTVPSAEMTVRLNGETIKTANLRDAYWSFPKMIAFVSTGEQIHPCDAFGSGTPFGGCLLDRGSGYLQSGDEVEIEVEGLGVLANRVV